MTTRTDVPEVTAERALRAAGNELARAARTITDIAGDPDYDALVAALDRWRLTCAAFPPEPTP